ncbi:MAG: hypothetical protein UU32_C0007G0011 [Candidatus Woesebacteria bacterium GW2011_GWB1_41_10]|uniref:DUF4012 domain-containing protein n=1 Tax=Candidatus Woesebacteria bacterium GW2011_GWB1_41_10 TaxID=1618577 RepID=A0A0G0UE23_9BACT|nr:MAG: hypothetical protein UU32_C0007G0011 [Candidatus Woesebacteria bacterium GW2011_GWB1_41_10]
MDKPIVAIFSDSNFFSIHLVENLLAKSWSVIVFAPDKKNWLIKTDHIANRLNLRVDEEKNFLPTIPLSYCIFCFGFLNLRAAYDKFKSLYSENVIKTVKSFAIFPSEIFDATENNNLPLNSNLAVIYLSNIFGPRLDPESGLRISAILTEVVKGKSMTVGVGEVFYPVFAPNVAREISKWLFSFGPYGKEIFVVGSQVSASELWRSVLKLLPDIKLFYDKNIQIKQIPRGFLRQNLESNLSFMLKETLLRVVPNVKKKQLPKFIKPLILFLVIYLALPVFSLLLASGLLYASYVFYGSGKMDLAKNLIVLSKVASGIGRVGLPYKEVVYGLNAFRKLGDVGLTSLEVIEVSKEFMSKVLGNEIYDPESFSGRLKVYSDFIYQSVSLLEAETKVEAGEGVIMAKKILNKVNFEKIKKVALAGSGISEELSGVLGKDGRKTYLVLFQNNMEIRPTGGFIGSFAIVTFEGGRMTDFSVSDVYSADGQLKGHIEPPKPIKDYLGEANWFLRDSNWDPDFPTSAKRAEWFIDKEIGRAVDGVIAIDLSPVKDALAVMGPMFLPDYNIDVTTENLYEKTQEEVHEDFFPGTHKKASFLTALSRNMVEQLADLDSSEKTGMIKTFYESLEQRHIQFYLHNEKIQSAISGLGWSGTLAQGNCGKDCYPDFVGLVEANVGVNKANYFISRDQNLAVNVLPDRIERELTVRFKNSANPGLGLPANYKSYVRILVPADAQVEGNYEITEGGGLKEIGFLLEVITGQEKEVVVSWSSSKAVDNYGVYIRKQAGTGEDGNLSVAINGDVVYNSNLIKDTWIQKP